ncbi:hypothetical protein CVT24_010602 [Panaeolus cyanescens]|uniref:DUF6533 domain-containing protein n=1 Tax=Panaeolus cyanescens TaxID=181874 RepID=A0A409YVS8_9AGAR|nr:hypothetical protein CVT24_010602 [Panaeolus cyanescens]
MSSSLPTPTANSTLPAASTLPNVYTPMAWLDPTEAAQITLRDYVVVGSCAVLMWDILDNLRKDYRVMTRYPFRLPSIVYIIARLGALGFALSASIFATSGIHTDCSRFAKIVAIFYPIAVPAASLLFLFRLMAVFSCNIHVILLNAFIWLALLASCILFPFGLYGGPIGQTAYCQISKTKEFIIAPVMISLVYDTVIFFFISWKLMINTHIDHDIRTGVKTLMFGDYLPAFSRTVLQDNQLYYMVTLPVNLVTATIFCVKGVPAIYHVMFTVANNVLMNIMACRVFRNTKLGISREQSCSNPTEIQLEGRTRPTDNQLLPLSFKSPISTLAGCNSTVPESMVVIHVSKSVERDTNESEAESMSDMDNGRKDNSEKI